MYTTNVFAYYTTNVFAYYANLGTLFAIDVYFLFLY